MTTNEAAERLRDWLRADGATSEVRWTALDAALAEERRHVIEQIREQRPSDLTYDEEVGYDLALDAVDDLSTPEQKR